MEKLKKIYSYIIMNSSNPLSSFIFGCILILLWIPSSYFIEVNNKNNNLEEKKLLNNITNITINKKNITYSLSNSLNTSKNDEYNKVIQQSKITNNINNYYYSTIEKEIDDKDSNYSYYTKIGDYTLYPKEMSVSNFQYLVKNYGNISNEQIIYNNINYKHTLYNFKTTDYNNLYIIGGLLDTNETENNNKYDIFIYRYEYSTLTNIDDIKQQIKERLVARKNTDNFFQKWGGRTFVFFCLFFGLILFVYPLESLMNTIGNYDFISNEIFSILVYLYNTFSLFASLFLTVMLTLLMYIIVNYSLTIIISALAILILSYHIFKNNIKN